MGELINSRIIIGEESTRRKEISQIRGSLAILWPENGLCLALNMVTEWPENFLFPVMNIEVCFFIFLNIHLFHSIPSPSSTSELSPWCLDNWSSCLTFPPASLTVSLHSVLYIIAESMNTTVTLLFFFSKYFSRFPCLQKEVHILYSKKTTLFF